MKPSALFISALLLAFSCQAKVTVKLNQQTLQFDTAPDMQTVLLQSGYNQHTYWPEAALFRQDALNSLQPLKQQVLVGLTALAEQEPKLAAFYREIANASYARRIALSLDIDRARTIAAANPRFDAGDYILQLGPRSGQVQVLGAVAKPGAVRLQGGQDVAHYIKQASPLSLADKSIAWLIRPNTKPEPVGIAYWNNDQVLPGSGAIIYLPFSRGLDSASLQQLNDALLQLVMNRIEL